MLETAQIKQLIERSKGRFEKYKGGFDAISRAYLSQFKKEVKESLRNRNKSHIFIPVIPSKVRRILASFQESYFANEDIVKLEQSLEYPQLADFVKTLQTAFNHYTQKEIKLFQGCRCLCAWAADRSADRTLGKLCQCRGLRQRNLLLSAHVHQWRSRGSSAVFI